VPLKIVPRATLAIGCRRLLYNMSQQDALV